MSSSLSPKPATHAHRRRRVGRGDHLPVRNVDRRAELHRLLDIESVGLWWRGGSGRCRGQAYAGVERCRSANLSDDALPTAARRRHSRNIGSRRCTRWSGDGVSKWVRHGRRCSRGRARRRRDLGLVRRSGRSMRSLPERIGIHRGQSGERISLGRRRRAGSGGRSRECRVRRSRRCRRDALLRGGWQHARSKQRAIGRRLIVGGLSAGRRSAWSAVGVPQIGLRRWRRGRRRRCAGRLTARNRSGRSLRQRGRRSHRSRQPALRQLAGRIVPRADSRRGRRCRRSGSGIGRPFTQHRIFGERRVVEHRRRREPCRWRQS